MELKARLKKLINESEEPYKPVKIVWMDSMGLSTGWTEVSKVRPKFATTIAFLVNETKEAYFVSHSYSPDIGVHYDLFMIPKGVVVSFEELGV